MLYTIVLCLSFRLLLKFSFQMGYLLLFFLGMQISSVFAPREFSVFKVSFCQWSVFQCVLVHVTYLMFFCLGFIE